MYDRERRKHQRVATTQAAAEIDELVRSVDGQQRGRVRAEQIDKLPAVAADAQQRHAEDRFADEHPERGCPERDLDGEQLVEGDIDWSGLNGTGTSAGCPGGCSTSETWLSTVRGRIGYAFDRVMPYATGGLAVGDIRASMPGFAGGTSTNAGWTLGGGVEFALPGNWTAKAEYLRVDLGSFNCTGCTPAPAGNVSLQENVFRAGVNYRFGWGK